LIDSSSLLALKEALAKQQPSGALTLQEFGKLLGRAVGRHRFSRSYVCQLLHGQKVITPRVEQAVRILLLGMAGLEDVRLTDPMPSFEGGPVARMQAGKAEGIGWQELYVSNQDVRGFVDTLIELILRG